MSVPERPATIPSAKPAPRALPRLDGGPVVCSSRLRPNFAHLLEVQVGNNRVALLSRPQVRELQEGLEHHLEEMEIDDRRSHDRTHPCVKVLGGGV